MSGVDVRQDLTVAPVNRVHHVHTITRVAEMLGEDEDWLSDVATEMDQEDDLIWVYGGGLRARCAEFHQHFVARYLHRGKLPPPQPLHLALTHGALLGHAVHAVGKDVEFAVLRQEFDIHAWPCLLPGPLDKLLLKARQASLRRAHQILRRRGGGAHLCQHRFSGDAAVHHPNAACAAVFWRPPGYYTAEPKK